MIRTIRILANFSLSALLIVLISWIPEAISSEADVLNVQIHPDGICASLPVEGSFRMEIRVAGPEGLVDIQTSDTGRLDWYAPTGLADGQYRYDIYITIEAGSPEDNYAGTTMVRKHGRFEIYGGSLYERRPTEELGAIEKTGGSLLGRALRGLFDFILPSAMAADLTTSNSYGGRIEFDENDQGDAQDWYVDAGVTGPNWAGFYIRDDVDDISHNAITVFHIAHSLNNENSFVVDTNGDMSLANGSVFIDRSNDNVGIGTTTPLYDLHIVGANLFLDQGSLEGDWLFNTGGQGLWFYNDGTATRVPVKFSNQAPDNSLVVEGETGEIGLGTDAPARQLHLVGSNAVFRMDRSADTAAFMLVRTTAAGSVLKNFVVGTNASGSNNGEFIINDLGTGTGGNGLRRMTINNGGTAIFTGSVQAASFIPTSSRRFKENVAPISDALAVTKQLEGVRFTWKENGRPALGLIAEDVAQVVPEVVERDDKDGQLVGVNYSALVAVLVEAVKEQQRQVEAQQEEISAYRARVASLEAQMANFKTTAARLDKIEDLVAGMRKPALLTQR